MVDTLPRDVWHHEIFPLLDDISFLCLQVAFCHRKLPTSLNVELEKAVTKYDISFVKYFMKRKLLTPSSIASTASIHGNARLLEYVLWKQYPIYYGTAIVNAVAGGHLEFLRVLYRNGKILDQKPDIHKDAIYAAAQASQIPCLKFLLEKKKDCVRWEDVVNRAIIEDRLEVFKFSIEYFEVDQGLPVNISKLRDLCRIMSRYGALLYLKYYYENLKGYLPDCLHITAIKYDQLNILQYLIDNGHVLNKEERWRCDALRSPVIRKYLIRIGYRFVDDICDWAVRVSNVGDICDWAVRASNADALQDLFEAGYKFSDATTLLALQCHSLECLKFACEHGARIHQDCATNAALFNKVEPLQYLHERGAIITENVVHNSVLLGNVICLEYALAHKFPVNIERLRHIDIDNYSRVILQKHGIDV